MRPVSFTLILLVLLARSEAAEAQDEIWYLRPMHIDSLPERVIPDTAAGAPLEYDPAICQKVFIDARNGTRYILRRDFMTPNGMLGDYALEPPGRYGVGTGMLVRMDCAIGRPLGAVPR